MTTADTRTPPVERRLVNAEPVRQHLRAVMAARNVGRRRTADLAGVPDHIVSRILYYGQRTVSATTAARILAVVPDGPPVEPRRNLRTLTDKTDATGTRRRIRGLHRSGYDFVRIAAALDEHPWIVQTWGRRTWISIERAQAVADLYGRWAGTPAERNGSSTESADAARGLARRRHWPRPGAWDGVDIDDPAAKPTPWYGVHRAEDLFADSEELLAQRIPLDVVAERLGVKVATLQRARERARSRARAAAALADPDGTP